jgi:hypothetical protein
MFHALVHVTPPIYACWAIVALLALAAGCNHGWHHARHNHPSSRLTRADERDAEGAPIQVRSSRRSREVAR